MNMFMEYDVVKAIKDIKHIPQGCIGTVLIAGKDMDTYIVEFFDNDDESIDITEVHESDIELINR